MKSYDLKALKFIGYFLAFFIGLCALILLGTSGELGLGIVAMLVILFLLTIVFLNIRDIAKEDEE